MNWISVRQGESQERGYNLLTVCPSRLCSRRSGRRARRRWGASSRSGVRALALAQRRGRRGHGADGAYREDSNDYRKPRNIRGDQELYGHYIVRPCKARHAMWITHEAIAKAVALLRLRGRERFRERKPELEHKREGGHCDPARASGCILHCTEHETHLQYWRRVDQRSLCETQAIGRRLSRCLRSGECTVPSFSERARSVVAQEGRTHSSRYEMQ